MPDPKNLRNIHELRLNSKIQRYIFWKQTETHSKSLQFTEENKLAAEISSWKGVKYF